MTAPLLTVIDGARAPTGAYLHDVFGVGGLLAKRFPGYRPREGQIKIAVAVDRAIREGHHVIAEGPVGVGKTYSYSVPAAYHAVHHGKKVLIVTANKNLQRQIYQKDLADLSTAVPWAFRYAIRKGIGSYLCQRDFESLTYRQLALEKDIDRGLLDETIAWAYETETGDFEDSPGPPPKVWSRFSTTREECDGRACSAFKSCFVAAARKRAAGAHLTVTNYHLFFLHLKLGGGSQIFPEFDVVILDESHNAAGIARDFFGIEITFNGLYRCATDMHLVAAHSFRVRGSALRDEYLAVVNELWAELGDRARRREHVLQPQKPLDCANLERLLEEAMSFYQGVANVLDPPDATMSTTTSQIARNVEAATYRTLATRCVEKAAQLAEFRQQADRGMVYFVEGTGQEEHGKHVRLKSKAIEVGGFMRRMLFERYKTVVMTSATLAVKGGSSGEFAYLRREMGMGPMAGRADMVVDELTVESPFNWPKQALLVIPRSMPIFTQGSEAWDQACCEHVEAVVNLMKGRTLCLFTSFRMLHLVKDRLRARTRWRILVQGEATNRELATEFQRDVHSVLLGTDSFSEGISIEGEACSCVLLDKIPFLTKDDPVVQGLERRRKERGSKESVFQTHMLPEAIISFKQRTGRLIRTVKDVGVVVVLDKRLLTKPYRFQFIKSIPPIRKVESLEEIKPFLKEMRIL